MTVNKQAIRTVEVNSQNNTELTRSKTTHENVPTRSLIDLQIRNGGMGLIRIEYAANDHCDVVQIRARQTDFPRRRVDDTSLTAA